MSNVFALKFADGRMRFFHDGDFYKLYNLEEGELCCLIGYQNTEVESVFPVMCKDYYGLYHFEEVGEQMVRAHTGALPGYEDKPVLFAPVHYYRKDSEGCYFNEEDFEEGNKRYQSRYFPDQEGSAEKGLQPQ